MKFLAAILLVILQQLYKKFQAQYFYLDFLIFVDHANPDTACQSIQAKQIACDLACITGAL